MYYQTYEEAYLTAKEIDKKKFEIGSCHGNALFMCSTSIPIENRLRLPIESMLNDFVKDMITSGADITIDNDTEIGQFIIDLGADVSDYITKEIERRTNIKFVCSYNNF